jgi:hypothetical protein
MTFKEACRRVFDAAAPSAASDKRASAGISKSGSVTVNREALHASDRYIRQIEALGKIDKKLKTSQG